jgi:hypothetical protein
MDMATIHSLYAVLSMASGMLGFSDLLAKKSKLMDSRV